MTMDSDFIIISKTIDTVIASSQQTGDMMLGHCFGEIRTARVEQVESHDDIEICYVFSLVG